MHAGRERGVSCTPSPSEAGARHRPLLKVTLLQRDGRPAAIPAASRGNRTMRILRLLSTRPLPCGCLAGAYETYTGPVVWILDATGAECTAPEHRPGVCLEPVGRAEEPPVDVRVRRTRRAR